MANCPEIYMWGRIIFTILTNWLNCPSSSLQNQYFPCLKQNKYFILSFNLVNFVENNFKICYKWLKNKDISVIKIKYIWLFLAFHLSGHSVLMAISTRVGRRLSLQQRQQRFGFGAFLFRFSSKRVFRAILISLAFIAFVPPIFFFFKLKRFHQVSSFFFYPLYVFFLLIWKDP